MEQPLDPYQLPPGQQHRVPIIQTSRCEGEWIPPTIKHALLISHSGSWAASLHGHLPIAIAISWPGTFTGKATLPTLGPPTCLYNCGCFPGWVWQVRVKLFFFFSKLHPEPHKITLSLKKKKKKKKTKNVWAKRPMSKIAWILKASTECRRKQHEKPITWKGAF